MQPTQLNKLKDFSLVLGGPLYQLYLRLFLATPPLNLYKRRIVFMTLFAWLPLLVLTMWGGVVISGVKIPFIYDVDTHVRFLLALALLIGAEVSVHKQITFIVQQFLDRDVIAKSDQPQFNRIIASTMRLRNSILVEVILIIFVYTAGYFVWQQYITIDTATWYADKINGMMQFTSAGYWYVYVSLPLFQFILCRWYFRLFIWYRFLWQVSRMPLHLNALHPDKAGGIGFLSASMFALSPLLIAQVILFAGIIANRTFYTGMNLSDYRLETAVVLIFLIFLVVMPLLFFVSALVRAKQNGLRDYGVFASDYVYHFKQKWLVGDVADNSVKSLGSPDVQTLADLSNSFQVVRGMRVIPINTKAILTLLILIALPLVPLIISLSPLEAIIDRLIKLIL